MITKKTKKTNILATGAIIALLPIMSHALQGVTIVEPFSCDVWLADYAHLTEAVNENNPKFVQEQLVISLEAVTKELAEHSECEVQHGK